ncbi:MAG: hypothetical protein OXF02_06205 [Simkaniaceae bacterium]|nr:hypothetical protein [Simkaniaceae bacterium]
MSEQVPLTSMSKKPPVPSSGHCTENGTESQMETAAETVCTKVNRVFGIGVTATISQNTAPLQSEASGYGSTGSTHPAEEEEQAQNTAEEEQAQNTKVVRFWNAHFLRDMAGTGLITGLCGAIAGVTIGFTCGTGTVGTISASVLGPAGCAISVALGATTSIVIRHWNLNTGVCPSCTLRPCRARTNPA